MGRQFSLSQLKEINKQYDEFVEIPVYVTPPETEEKIEHIIKLYPFFKPDKVAKTVEDLGNFIVNAKENKLNIPNEKFLDLVGYFIIKHFTNVKVTKSKKPETVYAEFQETVNSDLFKFLVDTFPKDQIAKVMNRIYEVIDVSNQITQQMEEIKDKVKGLDLQNKDILFGEEHNTKH